MSTNSTAQNVVSPVAVSNVSVGPGCPLAILAGPCVIESRDHTLRLAEQIHTITQRVGLPLIFKASFDKANRSSLNSYRGPGLDEGLRILADVRDALGVPIVSDIHESAQASAAGEVLDLLQIPAFLARQTDLLIAAAATGKPVNVKKGQFMAPGDMRLVVDKVRSAGGGGVMLCERGTFFGYGRLVNDMTGLTVMGQMAPVVFDVTHSCQLPGGAGDQTGGQREMAPVLARAAVAVGANALFIETHDDPANAKSDATTVWPVDRLEAMLMQCKQIAEVLAG